VEASKPIKKPSGLVQLDKTARLYQELQKKKKTLTQDFGNQTGESNEEQRNTTATCI